MNWLAAIVAFGMSAVFIAYICTMLICRRIHDEESRAAAMEAFDAELRSEQDESINGLEPAVVAGFPTMKFNSNAFHSREDAQCSICLGEYQEKEILRIMPTCGHTFHLTCIDTWLHKQSTCPVCRLSLQDSVEAKHMISPMFNTIRQLVDSSEVVTDHSYRWLLPPHEHSSSNQSNLEHCGHVLGNLESSRVGEEIRR
ncbi:putative RING-H2 finger protein ATL35 [Magnolia sinica]|uniref:putative RING-H2 finger protein ATL35 n=1 Tax=Magnolia sinica TaxID=86752 RepID=UPI002657C44D|nr:putative RING-H2 finger protein ATL35 [Magnolia sinica]